MTHTERVARAEREAQELGIDPGLLVPLTRTPLRERLEAAVAAVALFGGLGAVIAIFALLGLHSAFCWLSARIGPVCAVATLAAVPLFAWIRAEARRGAE